MPEAARGPRRGLVLGAGGVLGAAWTIGALHALEAGGVDPHTVDTVVGTSAGSVLAAFVGRRVPVEAMVNHQRGLLVEGDPRIEYHYDAEPPLPPRPRLRLGSRKLLATTARNPMRVTPMTALAAVLPRGRGSIAPIGALVDAVAPGDGWPTGPRTWIVTMDYSTGRRVPFGRPGSPSAPLPRAVMASCAIPGWYAPVEIGGRTYVDGGACSATSLDLLAPLGLDEVYVLAPMVSFEYDQPQSPIARLERRLRRAATRRLLREAAKVRAAGATVTVLGPGPEDLVTMGGNLMDARRREQVFETSLRTSATAFASGAPAGLPAAG
ncbi:MAG TPA: patatin-like phospholipase family protein [Frankiaceae bacterium]|nr:patatin-like phospholipase family protein [Frankiaceae bacterium]